MDSIKVSILCCAYNHEKYIKQCLDSFLSQKCNFKYEILINDDASTDNTASIIKEYEKKYPEIIKPFYQKTNLYSKKDINIIRDVLLPFARGKYISLCEGDDYWINPYKLQKQVTALENNKNCYFCVHNTKKVSEDGIKIVDNLPIDKFSEGIIKSDNFVNTLDTYNFHTSSYFFLKKEIINYYKKDLDFRKKSKVGDIPFMLYFGYIGDVYYIDEYMSAYRQNSVGSWTVNNRKSNSVYINNAKSIIESIKSYDKYTNYKYHHMCEKVINDNEYRIYYRNKEYRKVLEKKYRGQYKKLRLRRRIIIRVGSVFPLVSQTIEKIYEKINGYE